MKCVYQVLVQSLTNKQQGDLLVKLLDDRGGDELAMALIQTERNDDSQSPLPEGDPPQGNPQKDCP